MENTKLIIRMSKTARKFFKTNAYVLKMAGEENVAMNYVNPSKVYDVLPGTHHIEIESKNSSETQEITLLEGETKTLTINPVVGGNSSSKASLSRTQVVLLLFAVSIISIIGLFYYFENVPIPSIFLMLLAPFMLLFSKNKTSENIGDFNITIQNKAILK